MVSSRIEQIVGYVRQWRAPDGSDESLRVNPGLSDGDIRRLRKVIDDTIASRGGEMASRHRAQTVGATFSTLNSGGRRRFFELLATDYGHDDAEVQRAIDSVFRAKVQTERHSATVALRHVLAPKRELLLRRFAGVDQGLPFLVALREDLLGHLEHDPTLAELDSDLKGILTSWFDVALLRLEQLTWQSPALLLERLIAYEAVHAIESWDDLKGRMATGRRLYAFLHPGMPNDPLVFVEVALTQHVPESLSDVLDHSADRPQPTEATTAVFYSISNCHRGLVGVSLGELLIKSVVQHLTAELPNIKHFVTLSPLPGFRRHLAKTLADPAGLNNAAEIIGETGAAQMGFSSPLPAAEAVAAIVGTDRDDLDDKTLKGARTAMMALAADYLAHRRRGQFALDPVAHFHLTNGATIDRLNWMANPTSAGWEHGLGVMVNYRYQLKQIEANRDAYVENQRIDTSDELRRLINKP